MEIIKGLVELYKKVATSLPSDVEAALVAALQKEDRGQVFLEKIIENIQIARKTSRPICQDTGVPIFFVEAPEWLSQIKLKDKIYRATVRATAEIPLRANAVNPVDNTNSGNNTGVEFPVVYFNQTNQNQLRIDLILKGGGSENVSRLYKLPDESIGAGRDLDGIRRCVLDAVYHAQGKGCPPYIVAVSIGGTLDQVSVIGKRILLRKIHQRHPEPSVSELEESLLEEINTLGIGPLGLGGQTTALAVHIDYAHRHPATFFVEVTLMCWAHRRGTLIWR